MNRIWFLDMLVGFAFGYTWSGVQKFSDLKQYSRVLATPKSLGWCGGEVTVWLKEASSGFSDFGQKLHFLPFFPNHGETSGSIKIDLGVVKTFRERFWKTQNLYFSRK